MAKINLRYPLFVIGFYFLTVFSIFAEEISFDASLDADRVPMGSAAQLTLTVHGTQDVSQVTLPAIDGFEARYVGPSTQVKVVNGEYSTAKAFSYMLIPLKEGKFTIPAVEVSIKGQVFQTKPIIIDVITSASLPSQGQNGPSESAGAADPEVLSDTHAIAEKVQMAIALPASAGYLYEEVPLSVKLYVRELPVQDISFPQFTQDGYVLSEFSRPRQYQEQVNGKTFEVVEFNARLTATRSGTLTLGPAVITGSLLIKNNVRRNPFGNNAFDDEFFSGFFNSYQKKPLTITSRPVEFTVKPLPAEGKPAGFSGGVGRFTFDVTAAPLKVKAGDPVTLKMTVAGTGDLKTIRMPEFKDTRFKVYDPQVKESDGQKLLEQVIVPLNEGKGEIPALSFNYFDTSTGQYAVVTRGPFELEVLPTEKGQEFQAVGFTERPVSLLKESFGKDIVFVKDRPGRLHEKHGWMARNSVFLVVFVIFLNVWGAFLGYYLYRRKLALDPGFARRSVALRSARVALNALKPRIIEGAGRDFYTELFRIFSQYLEKKIALPPGGCDFSLVEGTLSSRGFPREKIALLAGLFELAERARFASAQVSVADMQRSYYDLEDILEEIERRVK